MKGHAISIAGKTGETRERYHEQGKHSTTTTRRRLFGTMEHATKPTRWSFGLHDDDGQGEHCYGQQHWTEEAVPVCLHLPPLPGKHISKHLKRDH